MIEASGGYVGRFKEILTLNEKANKLSLSEKIKGGNQILTQQLISFIILCNSN